MSRRFTTKSWEIAYPTGPLHWQTIAVAIWLWGGIVIGGLVPLVYLAWLGITAIA